MRIAIVIYGISIIALGILVFLKPQLVAAKLTDIYMAYPIIRFAGKKQLTSRPVFVRILGFVVIAVGIVALLLTLLIVDRL